MKKKKNIQIKPKYTLNKWIYVLFFTAATLCALFCIKSLDNDIWYLLSEGRYIVQNGIYHIDPLSMHTGLQVVVQNWLSASILWITFSTFGEMGIITLILILNFFIMYICYKLCMVISDNNPLLSLATAFATDAILIPNYIVTRPQVFSFVLLLSVLYVLELYIKNDNGKYLIWIPILSFIEANLHASLWWMIFLFILPYLIDGLKVKFLKTQGYRLKPLIIAVLVALAVGMINPYGYKMATFIFKSYGNSYMHSFISELLPFSINMDLSRQMLVLIILIPLCLVYFREGKVRLRYICLFCGTLLLGLMSVKAFSHFILVSIFPLAYFFKDMFPNKIYDLLNEMKKIVNWMFCPFTILVLCIGLVYYFTNKPRVELKHNASKVFDLIDNNFNDKNITIYSSFNDGGYVEYRGYKPYIDPRAEVFLKANNKKDDIFIENFKLSSGELKVDKFLEKYNFSFILVSQSDYLYNNLSDIKTYFIIFEDTENKYRLYAQNDLFEDDEREKLINDYNDALDKAIKKAQNKKH